MGPKGDKGDSGPIQSLHTSTIRVTGSLNPGEGQKTITATCPEGSRVTGGGYSSDIVTGARPIESDITSLTTWTVTFPPVSFFADVTVSAVCASLDPIDDGGGTGEAILPRAVWGSICGVFPGSSPECDGNFNMPIGIDVGSSNDVYVVNSGNTRVQKFESNGEFITKWGIRGDDAGDFNFPSGLAVSASDIYVSDTGNNRIQAFALEDIP